MRRAPLLMVLAGCAAPPPPHVPETRGPVVILASGPLLPPLSRVATHSWFAVRERGSWERFEIWYMDDGEHWGWVARRDATEPLSWAEDPVTVQGTLDGDRAQAFIDCLRRESPRYPLREVYLPVPGPNSNTYVDRMLRACGWDVELPSTAVGKDYRELFDVSQTTAGSGLQFETMFGGVALGVTEGIEIHVIGLTFGFSLVPPRLKLPFRI